jgi:hypothetical protein
MSPWLFVLLEFGSIFIKLSFMDILPPVGVSDDHAGILDVSVSHTVLIDQP